MQELTLAANSLGIQFVNSMLFCFLPLVCRLIMF